MASLATMTLLTQGGHLPSGVSGGARVSLVLLPARGRPPQAAARRAGLEVVEKLLTGSMLALKS